MCEENENVADAPSGLNLSGSEEDTISATWFVKQSFFQSEQTVMANNGGNYLLFQVAEDDFFPREQKIRQLPGNQFAANLKRCR